jgi:hypothetical protein
MSIQPIDLQTLFGHLHLVGKEQAAQKDAAVLQQTVQGQELAKETQHRDESVNRTQELEEETGKIDAEEKRNASSEHEYRKRQEQERDEEKKKRQVYQDPAIGKNIDITG